MVCLVSRANILRPYKRMQTNRPQPKSNSRALRDYDLHLELVSKVKKDLDFKI